VFCVATIRQRPYGPGAVDVDELGVVDKRLGQAVGVVRVARRVEAVFERAEASSSDWLMAGQFSFTPVCSMIVL
jgi:hypothetical protein